MYHYEFQRADRKSEGIDRCFNKILSDNVTNQERKIFTQNNL